MAAGAQRRGAGLPLVARPRRARQPATRTSHARPLRAWHKNRRRGPRTRQRSVLGRVLRLLAPPCGLYDTAAGPPPTADVPPAHMHCTRRHVASLPVLSRRIALNRVACAACGEGFSASGLLCCHAAWAAQTSGRRCQWRCATRQGAAPCQRPLLCCTRPPVSCAAATRSCKAHPLYLARALPPAAAARSLLEPPPCKHFARPSSAR